MKLLAIAFAVLGLVIVNHAQKTSYELSVELIHKGSGVEYYDTRPLNQGANWDRRNPETNWERKNRLNDRLSAFGGFCIIVACYCWWKHETNK
ncbi:hypothetical protein Pla144_04250 [Bythopirellula polymerisocia]|uniref:Uncharacterized protein n=1 Tax=Bythopirellula polymerisocia TaxID=2528003 RepID=A0A5C6D353_9BACT|nr:hypothetical protein Pla144_04250 [Bythopirellula polymerisocia]